MEPNELK